MQNISELIYNNSINMDNIDLQGLVLLSEWTKTHPWPAQVTVKGLWKYRKKRKIEHCFKKINDCIYVDEKELFEYLKIKDEKKYGKIRRIYSNT